MKFSHLSLVIFLVAATARAADKAAAGVASPIPWNQIGAKAGAEYKGDGLAVTRTDSGARLHCIFQRLDGEATSEGLWLTSTVSSTASDRFRVVATEIGRASDFGLRRQSDLSAVALAKAEAPTPLFEQLPASGTISISGQTVRFTRPGLTEEYTVSMDGVRQDFIVEQPPATATGDFFPSPLNGERAGVRGVKVHSQGPIFNELILKLSITGAK